MSKFIYVFRHAKSSWSDMSLSDKERPLNSRGKRDAPVMAGWFMENYGTPNKLITSAAVRAKKTALIFKEKLGIIDDHFSIEENLYHAPSQTYIDTCYSLDDSVSSVMLFGHNPGITYLANEVHDDYIENIPTCGVLIIESSTENWQSLDISNCKLKKWTAPKLI